MNYTKLFEDVLSNEPQFQERDNAGKNEDGAKVFRCTPQTRKEKIWQIFGGGDSAPEAFNVAYRNATNGPGYERRRIVQLNSSSLLALLCFWNVSKEHPITIEGIEYNEVYFEVENTVFEHDSSIDILLVSEKESTWLYLESKFTEPLNQTTRLWLSKKYHPMYQLIKECLNLEVSDVKVRKHKENGKTVEREEFEITQNEKRYYGGIKQMISHLIGLMHGISKNANNEYKQAITAGVPKSILLGAILYDFTTCDVKEFEGPHNDYVSFYEKSFADGNSTKIISDISNCIKEKNGFNASIIKIIPKVLTYQNVFGIQNPSFLMENVSLFYGINTKVTHVTK